MFFVSYCCWALKYHAAANFFMGGREKSKIELPWFLVNVAVNACQDLATLLWTGEGEGKGEDGRNVTVRKRNRHCHPLRSLQCISYVLSGVQMPNS
jgi:hypothetical protein